MDLGHALRWQEVQGTWEEPKQTRPQPSENIYPNEGDIREINNKLCNYIL